MRTWLIVLMITLVSAISFAQIPASNHVVMVVEGNHGYSSVIGNSTMPYLNSLASNTAWQPSTMRTCIPRSETTSR